jgi:enoyl-CoA hydratase
MSWAELKHLRMSAADGVATLVFDRPPVNAIDHSVIDEFLAAVDLLRRDETVRAVIVTGTDRSFSAGADVAMMRNLSLANHRRVRRWIDVQARLERLPKPVIAAIRGYALGGGAELALACDVRYLGAGAVIGFPEIQVGLFPGAGGTQRLPRLIGVSRAFRLIATGERLVGRQALEAGLVDEVVEDHRVLEAAGELAARLARGPARTLALLKRCLYAGWGRPLEEGLAIEEEAVLELIRSEEAREGLSAFLEKRAPRFWSR